MPALVRLRRACYSRELLRNLRVAFDWMDMIITSRCVAPSDSLHLTLTVILEIGESSFLLIT